jgi:hypothetical protein
MATQLHDTGEEFVLDYLFADSSTKPATLTIGLYNDSTDQLTDSSDLGDITSEPATGNYVRQSIDFDGSATGFGTADNSGSWEATNEQTVIFDVETTTETVDSYFVIINYQSDDEGDTAAADHLFWTGALEQSRDLSQIDTLNLNKVGVSLD